MLALGRALLAAPRVLVLDEPSIGLAPRLVLDLLVSVRGLVDRGLPVLLVEQNVSATLEVVDRVYPPRARAGRRPGHRPPRCGTTRASSRPYLGPRSTA